MENPNYRRIHLSKRKCACAFASTSMPELCARPLESLCVCISCGGARNLLAARDDLWGPRKLGCIALAGYIPGPAARLRARPASYFNFADIPYARARAQAQALERCSAADKNLTNFTREIRDLFEREFLPPASGAFFFASLRPSLITCLFFRGVRGGCGVTLGGGIRWVLEKGWWWMMIIASDWLSFYGFGGKRFVWNVCSYYKWEFLWILLFHDWYLIKLGVRDYTVVLVMKLGSVGHVLLIEFVNLNTHENFRGYL